LGTGCILVKVLIIVAFAGGLGIKNVLELCGMAANFERLKLAGPRFNSTLKRMKKTNYF
jgi:hypothetical protein